MDNPPQYPMMPCKACLGGTCPPYDHPCDLCMGEKRVVDVSKLSNAELARFRETVEYDVKLADELKADRENEEGINLPWNQWQIHLAALLDLVDCCLEEREGRAAYEAQ